MSDSDDPTFCPSCGQVFPRKTKVGSCGKCAKIDSCTEGSNIKAQLREEPQCSDCGLAFKNLSTEFCGLCRKARGEVDTVEQAARASRANELHKRLSTGRPQSGVIPSSQSSASSAAVATPAQAALVLATGNNVANASVVSGRTASANRAMSGHPIYVSVVLTCKGIWNKELGRIQQPFSENMLISDVIQECLEIWNRSWLVNHSASITKEDIKLEFQGHREISLDADPDINTLAEFYRIHTAHHVKGVYVPILTKAQLHKQFPGAVHGGQYIFLEASFNIVRYNNRIEQAESFGTQSILTKKGKQRKRAGSSSLMPPPSAIPAAKRPRTGVSNNGTSMPPVSSYSRASTHRAVHEITKAIKLVFVDATVSLDGQADIQWPANGKAVSAQIGDEVWQRGKTKHVFKLNIEGIQFVAKRFYDVGRGPSQLTTVDNYQNLHAELQRAIEGTHFLKKFFEHAEQLGQEVSKRFRFVEARLAKEIHDIDVDEYPSKASGLGPDDIDDDAHNHGAYWLIEPRRNIAVKKWTGTMSHRLSGFGQEDETLSAFIHFVWHYTNASVVLADLQSTLVVEQQSGRTVHELFDHMTHTYEGDSGVGDHGEEGVNAFVQQHECDSICRRLQLPVVKHKNMQLVAAPSNESEEEEEEGEITGGVNDSEV